MCFADSPQSIRIAKSSTPMAKVLDILCAPWILSLNILKISHRAWASRCYDEIGKPGANKDHTYYNKKPRL
jgi:hypothetical protein